jgi:hypothetical protein
METLTESFGWHLQGCLWASTIVGAKCWDQIAEGYSISNIGENAKVD